MFTRRHAGAVLAILLSASPMALAEDEVLIPFETVVLGTSSGIKWTLMAVVTTREEFLALWSLHEGKFRSPRPPPPEIGGSFGVAVFAGDRPSSGYIVEITKLVESEDHIAVYAEVSLAGGCGDSAYFATMTQPFHIVRVDRPPWARTGPFQLQLSVLPRCSPQSGKDWRKYLDPPQKMEQ